VPLLTQAARPGTKAFSLKATEKTSPNHPDRKALLFRRVPRKLERSNLGRSTLCVPHCLSRPFWGVLFGWCPPMQLRWQCQDCPRQRLTSPLPSKRLAGDDGITDAAIECHTPITLLHMATTLRLYTTRLYIQHTRTMRPIGITVLTTLPIELEPLGQATRRPQSIHSGRGNDAPQGRDT
jgi:hypothetical protein